MACSGRTRGSRPFRCRRGRMAAMTSGAGMKERMGISVARRAQRSGSTSEDGEAHAAQSSLPVSETRQPLPSTAGASPESSSCRSPGAGSLHPHAHATSATCYPERRQPDWAPAPCPAGGPSSATSRLTTQDPPLLLAGAAQQLPRTCSSAPARDAMTHSCRALSAGIHIRQTARRASSFKTTLAARGTLTSRSQGGSWLQ